MRKTILLVLLLIPATAYADFWGIGEAVAGTADASWKIYLIKTLASLERTIILETCIIGAIGCAWLAGRFALKFEEIALAALKDGTVTLKEAAVLTVSFLVGLPTLVFGLILGYTASTALLELLNAPR